MMRRSGCSPAVKRWKFSWLMLRRAASGHIEATQLSKFAAACRIALAVISGWPEAPSSPLHIAPPPLPGEVCGCAGEPELGPEKMLPNSSESPPPDDWALAVPDSNRAATTRAAAAVAFVIGSVA